MRKLYGTELKEILEAHKKFINKEQGGIRADLRNADLSYANLSGADLRRSDLSGADLRNTNLSNIQTNKNCYQVAGVGSSCRLVSYFVKENIVVCGCWKCEEGNTLENFKKRVEDIYGEEGKTPNELYYREYQVVIKFFESMCSLKINKKL